MAAYQRKRHQPKAANLRRRKWRGGGSIGMAKSGEKRRGISGGSGVSLNNGGVAAAKSSHQQYRNGSWRRRR
jgi:hypothetical protein